MMMTSPIPIEVISTYTMELEPIHHSNTMGLVIIVQMVASKAQLLFFFKNNAIITVTHDAVVQCSCAIFIITVSIR